MHHQCTPWVLFPTLLYYAPFSTYITNWSCKLIMCRVPTSIHVIIVARYIRIWSWNLLTDSSWYLYVEMWVQTIKRTSLLHLKNTLLLKLPFCSLAPRFPFLHPINWVPISHPAPPPTLTPTPTLTGWPLPTHSRNGHRSSNFSSPEGTSPE